MNRGREVRVDGGVVKTDGGDKDRWRERKGKEKVDGGGRRRGLIEEVRIDGGGRR